MSQSEVHIMHEVHITIDRKNLTSPNPTTGHALYVLGEVPQGTSSSEKRMATETTSLYRHLKPRLSFMTGTSSIVLNLH